MLGVMAGLPEGHDQMGKTQGGKQWIVTRSKKKLLDVGREFFNLLALMSVTGDTNPALSAKGKIDLDLMIRTVKELGSAIHAGPVTAGRYS
jgi:hypothetical protein